MRSPPVLLSALLFTCLAAQSCGSVDRLIQQGKLDEAEAACQKLPAAERGGCAARVATARLPEAVRFYASAAQEKKLAEESLGRVRAEANAKADANTEVKRLKADAEAATKRGYAIIEQIQARLDKVIAGKASPESALAFSEKMEAQQADAMSKGAAAALMLSGLRDLLLDEYPGYKAARAAFEQARATADARAAVVARLVKMGADPSAKDARGQDARGLAASLALGDALEPAFGRNKK